METGHFYLTSKFYLFHKFEIKYNDEFYWEGWVLGFVIYRKLVKYYVYDYNESIQESFKSRVETTFLDTIPEITIVDKNSTSRSASIREE